MNFGNNFIRKIFEKFTINFHIAKSGIEESASSKRSDNTFADFNKAFCQNATFNCHRSLLSARSYYFKGLLESGMKENTTRSLNLHDIEGKDFKQVLELSAH